MMLDSRLKYVSISSRFPSYKHFFVGRGGELWTINSTDGKFIPHPKIRNSRCGDIIDSKLCTRPHALDGYTFKDALAVNYQIPGPIIIVNQGQIVSVNVTNGLESDVVSIHWHGMHQRNTNFMDGAEHITQCGAPPGASFRYIFEAAQSGTFWYYAHRQEHRDPMAYMVLSSSEKKPRKLKWLNQWQMWDDLKTNLMLIRLFLLIGS